MDVQGTGRVRFTPGTGLEWPRDFQEVNVPRFRAVVMKSGNLKFLEPSGPLQACNGTALPLPLKRFRTHNTGDKVGPRTCKAGCIGAYIAL